MAASKAKTQDSKEKMEEAYELAGEATAEAAEVLKGKAKESLSEGTDKIKGATSQVENVIKERPLLSVGCAFLAGWALSKVIK